MQRPSAVDEAVCRPASHQLTEIDSRTAPGVAYRGWRMTCAKGPMTNSLEAEQLRERLGVPELPEMVFPRNIVRFAHESGVAFEFHAEHALRAWDATATPPRLQYSADWLRSRRHALATGAAPAAASAPALKQAGAPASTSRSLTASATEAATTATPPPASAPALVHGGAATSAPTTTMTATTTTTTTTTTTSTTSAATATAAAAADDDAAAVELSVYKPYEWTYTTTYRGTIVVADGAAAGVGALTASEEQINFELLRRRDPILFHGESVLYQDELADNGDSIVSVKFRVMPTCFLVLLRLFMRVDDTMFRVLDTRYVHEFGQSYVLRAHQRHEATFDELRARRCLPSDKRKLTNADVMIPVLPVREHETHRIALGTCALEPATPLQVPSSPRASAAST